VIVRRWLERWGESVLVPLGLIGLYVALIETSGAAGAARVVALGFLVFVLLMWFGFRRLKLHAQASRLAGIGEPEQLLALVARELPRCLTEGGRRPLHVHAAIAHNLRSDFAAARRSLDASGFLVPTRGRGGRGWVALAAAADVTTRTEVGDLAGARASYERGVAPVVALAPLGGLELVARECQARLLLGAGEPAEARAALAPMVKNIRLSDGTRAQVHALLARAAAALGEDAVAAEHAAKARALAPRCQLLPASLAGADATSA
jgi:hypothetical protein